MPIHVIRDDAVPKASPQLYSRNKHNLSKFSYMFTRDPFDRALSGYFDKVVRRDWLGGRNMTLNEYFNVLNERKTSNIHFATQLSICDPCQLNISFLGRTETMYEDMDYIINYATNMHEKVTFQAVETKRNDTFASNKSEYDIEKLKTLSLEKVLAFIFEFRNDYLALGYNPYHAILRYIEINSS